MTIHCMFLCYNAADKSGTVAVFIDIQFYHQGWLPSKDRQPSLINPPSNAHNRYDTSLLPPRVVDFDMP